MEEIEPLLDKLREIGKAHDKTPSQVALNWCICKGTIPIVGVKNKKQVQENLEAIGWRLTSQEIAELDKFTRQSSFSIWQSDR
jgi:pyridoxine 4-dehydrogenase